MATSVTGQPGDTGPGNTGPGDTGPANTVPGDTGPANTGSGNGAGDEWANDAERLRQIESLTDPALSRLDEDELVAELLDRRSYAGKKPTVLIVEPDGGHLVDAGHIAALEDARHMTPQGVADWLARWAK